ncbi:MAG: SDR family oxidoreductase [Anaerolineales bacterium]
MNPLALVTGGAKRLGAAFALRLAQMGYDIALHSYATPPQETRIQIEALGRRVFLLRANLTQPQALSAMMEKVAGIKSQGEDLQVVVNSAGVMRAGDVRGVPLAEWDETLNLNLRAPFLISQAAAPLLSTGGVIINISDIAAGQTWTRYPAYVVSKAALESLTKILARALAPNIRVNAIAPGLALPSNIISAEEWQRLVSRLPLQRPAALDDLTAALEFLIRNQSITGQVLAVDCGYSLL